MAEAKFKLMTMNSSILPRIAGNLAAFGVAVFLGWNLGAPASVSSAPGTAAQESRRASPRPQRAPVSAAADTAGKRVAAICDAIGPEARMRATVALAYSLSPGEFADWMGNGWFTLRGGPELTLFTKILEERWQQEDPEGLLQWTLKNKGEQTNQLVQKLAETEPQRLIDYFKANPGDPNEMYALWQIAGNHPDLALQRLIDLAPVVDPRRGYGISMNLLSKIAEKSPGALEAAMADLSPSLRQEADAALSQARLKTSFDDEIQRLWDRPDGWKIFEKAMYSANNFSGKIFDHLADLPPEWRAGIAGNPYNFIQNDNAEKWLEADLGGYGFSETSTKQIKSTALSRLAGKQPEEVLTRMAEMGLSKEERSNIISNMFSSVDQKKGEALIASLDSEDEKSSAQAMMDSRNPEKNAKAEKPGDILKLLSEQGASRQSSYSYLNLMKSWDPAQMAEFQAGFKNLSKEQKQQASLMLAQGSMDYSGANTQIAGQSIRYLIENPPAPVATEEQRRSYDQSPVSMGATYAVKLSSTDPQAAVDWVKTLPAGEAKLWAQKNLYNNWRQYDPTAADRWEKALPAADKEAIKKLGVRTQ